MSHPVMYFEVSGKDAAKLTDFYAGLFEWNVNTDPSTGYGYVDPVERGMGGGIAPTSDGSPGTVALLDQLEPELEQDHRWHAARADLLMPAGRVDEAIASLEHALRLCRNQAERSRLERWLGEVKIGR